jgi:FixJ family two-component response regulator
MTSLSAIGTRASSSAATREPLAILIIDDDAGDRALCKRTVSGAFGDACKTFTCDTGEQGLETIEKHKPECVLLDYCLPGLNGLDVLKRIRARHPYLPVIFITGRGDVPLAVEALKAGADDFLEKAVRTGKSAGTGAQLDRRLSDAVR